MFSGCIAVLKIDFSYAMSQAEQRSLEKSLMEPSSSTDSIGQPSTRRGSNNDEFDKEWEKRFQWCSKQIQDLLLKSASIEKQIKKYGTAEDSLAHRRSVEVSIAGAVDFISKVSVDIVELSDMVDAALDLDIETINNFDKYEDFDDISPKLIQKKRSEIKLAKKFKDSVDLFMKIQSRAVEKSKEFVLKVKGAPSKNARRDQFLKAQKKDNAPAADQTATINVQHAQVETLPDALTQVSAEECRVIVQERTAELVRMQSDVDKVASLVANITDLEANHSDVIDRLMLRRDSSKLKSTRWERIAAAVKKNYCWFVLGASAGLILILILSQH